MLNFAKVGDVAAAKAGGRGSLSCTPSPPKIRHHNDVDYFYVALYLPYELEGGIRVHAERLSPCHISVHRSNDSGRGEVVDDCTQPDIIGDSGLSPGNVGDSEVSPGGVDDRGVPADDVGGASPGGAAATVAFASAEADSADNAA